MKALGLALTLLGVLALPASLLAQADLNEVETLAAMGRGDEARAVLLDWWEGERSGASRNDLQRGLWLRGRLTVDPMQAARDFRRLMVEYPGGPYTDGALFRLAQGAYAAGDVDRSRSYMASLARDYPNSAVRRQAESWLVGAGPPPTPAARVERESAESVVGRVAAEEPPTRNEERAAASPVSPPPERSAPRVDPPATTGRYSVQLGAFSGAERAEALRQRAEDAGLEARVVNVMGSRLIHVRVGRFDSSGEASVFFRNVTGLGFTAAVVRDADREEPARQ